MERETTVEVTEIQMTQIVVRTRNSWAKLRYQESTGFVSIQSDYGSWSNSWCHYGDRPLASFLLEINRDYAGGKFLGAAIDVFDVGESIQSVKRHILDCRRETAPGVAEVEEFDRAQWQRKYDQWAGGIGRYPGIGPEVRSWTKTRAREEWRLTALIEESQRLDEWYAETSIDDAIEIAHSTRMDHSWCQFWDLFWEPHIRPELRKLAKVAA